VCRTAFADRGADVEVSMRAYLANEHEAICGDCGEPCEVTCIDDSFDYDGPGGTVATYRAHHWESVCCGAEPKTERGHRWEPQYDY